MCYDGPFKIIEKLSLITYQVRMPASYGIHPILKIAHLEDYKQSLKEFRMRPTKHLGGADFTEVPEFEVEKNLKSHWRAARNGQRTEELLTKFVGYGPQYNEWLTRKKYKKCTGNCASMG